jgi:hypothetical protein
MLTIAANDPTKSDTLPASVFPTHGGDVTLHVGTDIVGAMNSGNTVGTLGTDQELPYDMTALGSQLKLQNGGVNTTTAAVSSYQVGNFNDVYATDGWLKKAASKQTYYTLGNPSTKITPGDYQLAWYTWFPYLENTIGSFGGGNISVKAGGNVSNIQFVSPTNAHDAGPLLVANAYGLSPTTIIDPNTGLAASSQYTGLYVQGGGNVSLKAGGNITLMFRTERPSCRPAAR